MIAYNPKDWIKFVLSIHKADTFYKLLYPMLAVGIWAALIAYLEVDVFQLEKEHQLKNVSVVHTLLGFVISALLVFRINTAYDRWWEGRKQWGSLVNSSRNLAMKLSAILPKDALEDRQFLETMISNYAFVLKNHLRKVVVADEFFETDVRFQDLMQHEHLPNQVALLIMQRVHALYEKGVLKAEHLFILNAELQNFTDVCGACERIRNTPIPFSYSAFLKKFIVFYVLSLPIGYVFGLKYLVIPVVIFIFYVLTSLELVAEEIEDPFGTDMNDLPLDVISKNISKTVKEIL